MSRFDFAFNEIKNEFKFKIFKIDPKIELIKDNRAFISFNKQNNSLSIHYIEENDIYRLILESSKNDFKKDFLVQVSRQFKSFSLMIDLARNNVLKIETIKKLIRIIALLGYNSLKLYLEDVFEVNNEPYFGYLRGRYSKEDLKSLVNYASYFGIEIIPCIETLAHMNALKHWCIYREHFDIDDIMMVGDNRVYKLIKNIFSTLSEIFPAKKVNIGMDEAHHLGLGKYLDKYGYKKRYSILKEHLEKILFIANQYGFKCEMRSDMFFNNTLYNGDKTEAVSNINLNKDLRLIYWDYEERDEHFFNNVLKIHKNITDKIGVAGGAWKWLGFAPNNYYSIKSLKNILKASCDANIEEFTITCWADNGGEASIFSVLPSIVYGGNINFYGSNVKEDFLFKELTRIDFDKFMYVDLPNYATEDRKTNKKNAFGRIYLYNDLLLGFYDSCVTSKQKSIYKKAALKLKEAGFTGDFSYIFKNIYNLLNVLYEKIDLGIEIREAYKSNDKTKLILLQKRLKTLLKCIEKFYESFYFQRHKESVGNGFDVEDLRIGGLIQRIKTTYRLIDDFLKGKISKIDELEEEILDFYGNEKEFYKPIDLVEFSYIKISTVNVND